MHYKFYHEIKPLASISLLDIYANPKWKIHKLNAESNTVSLLTDYEKHYQ